MQNRTFLLLISLVLCFSASAQKYAKLFNGENLKGWYAFTENGKTDKPETVFKVNKGMIRLYGPTAGYLMSAKSFDSFELTAEFRWNTDTSFVRKSSRMNSGLMYLVPETAKDTLWPQGIQFQIKEKATGDFVLLQNVTITQNGTPSTPGRSVVLTKNDDNEKAAGEWNLITVRVENGKVSQFLNGQLVNEGTSPSVTSGRILLQYEGYPIDFRNLRIHKL